MSKVLRIAWGGGLVLLLGGMIALALRIEHDEEAEEREREAVSSPRHVRSGKVELEATLVKNAGIETTPARNSKLGGTRGSLWPRRP